VKTHLLGVLDDPAEVLERYCGALIQPHDVLTIGETPLAVMQGRYRHPEMVEPSMLSRLLCRVFHPTSSLATACGLQTLIDIVGPARVLCAWLGGFGLKLVGSKGGFYRLAGPQARLIDDVTGTTPPYDQTLVLGPDEPERFCERMAAALGVAVAVVDVNDLGRVMVLAASALKLMPVVAFSVLEKATLPVLSVVRLTTGAVTAPVNVVAPERVPVRFSDAALVVEAKVAAPVLLRRSVRLVADTARFRFSTEFACEFKVTAPATVSPMVESNVVVLPANEEMVRPVEAFTFLGAVVWPKLRAAAP
jgi:hypothetical protein